MGRLHVAKSLWIEYMFACVQKLYAEGGVPRFFKGWTPCLLRAVPANGVMLLTVDKVTAMLS